MKKVKFIPNHNKKKCYLCEGKGCKKCNGTGVFIDTHYHLVYTNKKGQEICYGVDTIK